MKPPLTPEQKQQKKARDNLKIRQAGLLSAWTAHQLHTWRDVYEHESYTQTDIDKFENKDVPLTYPALKDYLKRQSDDLEKTFKKETTPFTQTPQDATPPVRTDVEVAEFAVRSQLPIPFKLVQSRESSDCTVTAVSSALSLPYEQIHNALVEEGRQHNNTLRASWFSDFLRGIGFELLPDCNIKLRQALELCQKGKFVLRISGHAFAVVDGTVYDNQTPDESWIVERIYKFVGAPQIQAPQAQEKEEELDKRNNYGYTRDEYVDASLMWFQKKATAELKRKIVDEKKSGVLLLAPTGSGKTYIMAALLEWLQSLNWADGKTWNYIWGLVASKATILEQTDRVFYRFNLKPDVDLAVTNIESLRATFGQMWLKREAYIDNGEEKERWVWKKNLQPPIFAMDESQGAKNPGSMQSQLVYSYNNIMDAAVCLLCISATPFTRVSEAQAFAVSTHRPLEHLGFPPGSVLTNENWPLYAKIIAHPSKPEEYNEAAVGRLRKDLEDWIVQVKGIHPQFNAINGVKIVQFSNKESAERYYSAWERFVKDMAKLAKLQDEGGKQVGMCRLAVLLRFAIAAENEHAEQFADDMWRAFKAGKAPVAAVKFKSTLIKIVKYLHEKHGVSRDDISLIWGGGQTQMNEKQKNKEKIKSMREKLEKAGMSVDELLELAGLEEVEDRVIEDLPAHLRLGAQSMNERQKEIDKFQAGESRFCIYTLKSGGVGLSLHHTDELTTRWDSSRAGYDEWKKEIDEWNKKHPTKQVKPGKCRRKESGYAFEQDIPFIPVRQRETFCVVTYNAIELVQAVGRVPRLTSLSDTTQNVYCFAGTIEVDMGRIYSQKLRCLSAVIKAREHWQDVIFGGNSRSNIVDAVIKQTADAVNDESSLIDEGDAMEEEEQEQAA